jgi:hypothetical protein
MNPNRLAIALLLVVASLFILQRMPNQSLLAADVSSEVRWETTGSFPAAEAHQAAAADEKLIYVINNTTVAAYDRKTLQRQWLSHGGHATHLNSGFVWQDRLFCAHSNYPRVPNTSQIKVVDLIDGKMSDFKDFGISDGSLTWAVHHQDAWWCNFAFYGNDQQKTRLVRFDDDWQEVGSWTYPAELFRHLGQHSLSGGTWNDETLLVTDHDNPIIYRLRLPQAGTTLEWIDRASVPFTGQGFAIDPLHGEIGGTQPREDHRDPDGSISLIGIHRAKRLVIFASPMGR